MVSTEALISCSNSMLSQLSQVVWRDSVKPFNKSSVISPDGLFARNRFVKIAKIKTLNLKF